MMNRHEFEASVTSPDSMNYWLSKTKREVAELLGNDVGNMVGFDQRNPHHCFDLFSHSLHAVKSIQRRTASLPACERNLLLCAAFFHDIGKIECAMDRGDRLVFYGHSKKSAEITRPILNEMGYLPMEISEVCFYIAHHDDFISFVTPQEFKKSKNRFHREINKNNIMGHIREKEAMLGNRPNAIWYRRSHWDSLCVLCLADADAQSLLVKQNGKVIDSRKHKQAKIAKIRSIIAALSC